MLGYSTDKDKELVSWGHITCGGTVANIEAIWAARNLKYHPLAVQNALKEEPELSGASKFKVLVPRKGKTKEILGLEQWDLLNLGIDEVIGMTNRLATESNMDIKMVSNLVKKYNIETLGIGTFFANNNIKKTPVVLSPASNHYSWPKGMTLLGMGDSNLVPVAVDETGRQNLESLRECLSTCLQNKQPVIAVVSVMGTTEEGAIDPLEDIYKLKQEFEKKGLSFSLHGDAAWGGYLCTMLVNDPKQKRNTNLGRAFNHYSPLNEYSIKHLRALKFTDSITVDPHKTGLIPYPAGGLCYRNGSMRNFVTLTAPVVFHGGSEPNIGVYGIEGSKPGAAAVATLLSHRVIGLDQEGYGRIMGQCLSGAKLFYCLWMIVANDDDPFICLPLFPLPNRLTVKTARKFILNKMTNKAFEELMNDKDVLLFLSSIGGDAMVNPFVINIRGNKDVKVANQLMMSVFNRLSYTNALTGSNHKVPLLITQSEKNLTVGVKVLKNLKEKVGLNSSNDTEPLSFLINTVLNPFINSFDIVHEMGQLFREAVLLSIGEIQNDPHNHGFISMGMITDSGFIIGDHLPVFTEVQHQYHAVVKFQFLSKDAIKKIQTKQKELRAMPKSQRLPITFGNPNPMTLPSLVQSEGRHIEMACFVGPPSETNPPFLTNTPAIVTGIIRFSHFDMTAKDYPENLEYWLFGDDNGAYISHVMTLRPDMHQVVALDSPPQGVDKQLLADGLHISLPSLPGKPFKVDGHLTDPLQEDEYTFNYIGRFNKPMKSSMQVAGEYSRIWTDFTELNVAHHKHEEEDKTSPEKKLKTPLDKLIDKNLDKYMKHLKDCYGIGISGYDPNSPAHPGDIVSLKEYKELKLHVDFVFPKQQVLGITVQNTKDRGIIRYLNYFDIFFFSYLICIHIIYILYNMMHILCSVRNHIFSA